MNMLWLLLIVSVDANLCSNALGKKTESSIEFPPVVNIGAILSFDSTIGKVAEVAIRAAVNDVNSNSSLLPSTKLVLHMQNSNCSGFMGMIRAIEFMVNDVIAIIGPQSSVVAHIISHFSNELQVPLLSFAATDPTLSSLQFPFFVRTTQSDLFQMEAVAEIVDYYGWKDVIVVFIDDDFGRNGIMSLSDKLEERRCKISFKAAISPGSAIDRGKIVDILVKLMFMESRVIVVHVNLDIGVKLLEVANSLELVSNGYVWIATDWLTTILDTQDVKYSPKIMNYMQGLVSLRHHTPASHVKSSLFSRWGNLTGSSFGLNSYGLYAYDTVWLIAHAVDSFLKQGGTISFSRDPTTAYLEEENRSSKGMDIFDSGKIFSTEIFRSSFQGVSGTVKFNPDRTRAFPAYDVINVIGTGFRQVGYWSNRSGLSTTSPELLYTRPPDRSTANRRLHDVIWPGQVTKTPRGWVFPNNGVQLRVGVPIRVGFKDFVSHIPETDMFKGFCIDVFLSAISLLPYALPYRFVPFGDGRKNPSYTELVSSITTGDFDIVVGDVTVTTNRTKVVDFSQPFAASGLVVVAPYRELSSGGWSFLLPFTPSLWCVMVVFFIMVGVVVWVLEHRINDDFRGPPRKQLITVFWFGLSTLFFAHKHNTASNLGRFVLVTWLFVVLIMGSGFTASLTSILTVRQLSSHVKGLESLKGESGRIGYQVGSFAKPYLEELGISESRLVPLGSPEEYAEALQNGHENDGVMAIVDELPYMEIFLSTYCNFQIVGREFTKSGWGFVFEKESQLTVDFSRAILALSEEGDLQRIHDKWVKKSICTSDVSVIEANRLHLKSFWGLFAVCGLACFLALLLRIFEVFARFYKTSSATTAAATATMDPSDSTDRRPRARLKRFITIIDQKEEVSKNGRRKRPHSSSTSINEGL